MDKETDYKNLFQRVALADFPLNTISEIEAFHNSCTGEVEESRFSVKAKTLLSLVYFVNDMPQESLSVDIQLAKDLPPGDENYGSILLTSIKTITALNETDKVTPFVLNYLKHGTINFNVSILLLYWYTKTNGIHEHDKTIIAAATADAIIDFGIVLNTKMPLEQQIEILNAELDRANKDLHNFKVEYQNSNEEERKILVSDYLTNESSNYFKSILTNYYAFK
jgi:hypothetical protein